MSDSKKYHGYSNMLSLRDIAALCARGDSWDPAWPSITVRGVVGDLLEANARIAELEAQLAAYRENDVGHC